MNKYLKISCFAKIYLLPLRSPLILIFLRKSKMLSKRVFCLIVISIIVVYMLLYGNTVFQSKRENDTTSTSATGIRQPLFPNSQYTAAPPPNHSLREEKKDNIEIENYNNHDPLFTFISNLN